MKKLVYLFIMCPIIVMGQIPVTDAATNASLGISNQQLLQMNLQLKSINAQLNGVNRNLVKVIRLLEKNNNISTKSREILKEELDAKKTAPNYVLQSQEVVVTEDLKNKILAAYRSSEKQIRDFKNLESSEKKQFLLNASEAIKKTNALFKQCKTILNTNSIINPEERINRIGDINARLEQILDELIAENEKFLRLNTSRKIRQSVSDIN
jgi:hypothetical protein